MCISKILTRTFFSAWALVILLFAANVTMAQTDSIPKKRLQSPAIVKGNVGGEAHDSYVIRVRKGQILTVKIFWQPRKDNNRAEFTVSRSVNFFNADRVKFGKEADYGSLWSGKVQKSGNYFIYVVAHPSAIYTLKATVK